MKKVASDMNIDRELYSMIFKRKSFHLFRNMGDGRISTNDIEKIEVAYQTFIPLCPDIKTAIRIVPASETTCKRGIMPADKVTYYNQIDIGIFLCFLELCLEHNGIDFERKQFVDAGTDEEKTVVATYRLYPTLSVGA